MHDINPIIYKYDDCYAGYAAELPGATGQGSTIEETVEEIIEAVKELCIEYERMNLPVPWKVQI